MKNKIIVFEGLDHSFKETNAKKLYEYIKENITDKVILQSFPNYESDSSRLVKKYLNKEFGKLNEINPYTTASFYALDRYETMKQYEQYKDQGYYIILDRYIGSQLYFGSANILDPSEKIKYIDWILKNEFEYNKLPRPDITLFMDMPADISYKLSNERKHKSKMSNDIHEENKKYMQKVEQEAKFICKNFAWDIIKLTCNNQILSEESIFKMILLTLQINNIIL